MRDRVFRHTDLEDFAQRYVTVRLLGGKDATADTCATWVRYSLDSFPTNLAIAPDGALLRQESIFDDPEALIAFMQAAETASEAYEKERAGLFDEDASASIQDRVRFLIRYGVLEEAERLLETLSAAEATTEDRLQLIEIYRRQGRLREREKALQNLIEREPDHPDRILWTVLLRINHLAADLGFATGGPAGDMQEDLDRVHDLESLLEETTRIPDQATVRREIANHLLSACWSATPTKQSDYRTAADRHRTWIAREVNPTVDEPRAALTKAEVLTVLGERDPDIVLPLERVLAQLAAQDEWPGIAEEALELQTTLAGWLQEAATKLTTESWAYLWESNRPSNDYAQTLEKARRARELRPESWSSLNTLGVACYRMGSYEEAVRHLEQAAEKEWPGGSSWDFFFLSMSRLRLGDANGARTALVAALNAWPRLISDSADWRPRLEALLAETDAVAADLLDDGAWASRQLAAWQRVRMKRRLGVVFGPEFDGGILVVGLAPGFRVALQGLQKGDRIVGIGDRDLQSLEEFVSAVLAETEGSLSVRVKRGDEILRRRLVFRE